MDYRQAVEEGRKAAQKEGDAKWRLGDLALEVAPMGQDHGRNGSHERLRKYAEDIGVEYEQLATYRKVASAWAEGARIPSASWTVHRVLMVRKELIRPGMTLRAAYAARGSAPIDYPKKAPPAVVDEVRDLDAQQKAEIVAAALEEPEVARKVIDDGGAIRHIRRAQTARFVEEEEGFRKRVPSFHKLEALDAVERALDRMLRTLDEAIREVSRAPDDKKLFALVDRKLVAAQGKLDMLRAVLNAGPVDEELQKILDGGA